MRYLKNCVSRFALNKRFFSVKRKYPINPEAKSSLPVFDYGTSKTSYNRVFVWGNLQTGALGILFMEKNSNKFNREFLLAPKRLGFAEKFAVTSVACGFGFTAFAVNSKDHKLYGSGINTDSQVGRHEVRQGHPLEIIYAPQPIFLPFKDPSKAKILKLSAGRAHLAVLTNEGLFLLGNNSYGQCARKTIPDEDYFRSNFINHVSDLDGVKITDVECGQDHTLALTEKGEVYSCGFGADGQTGLETFSNTEKFTKVRGDIENEKIVKVSSRSDCVLALNQSGEVFGWGNAEYDQIWTESQDKQVCTPLYLKSLKSAGKIKDVATGGSFCLVLNEKGEVFSWGFGILGFGPEILQESVPKKIPHTLFGKNDFQPDNEVLKVCCGLSHAVAVTSLGDIYAWGRNTRGCLGLGDDKDQFFPLKVSLGGQGKEVYCGYDHTIAICKPFI